METRASSRDRIGRHHAAPPERRLRPVMPWLQDVNDPDYRARLAEECRHLADLTPAEDNMAAGFARIAERTEGWR